MSLFTKKTYVGLDIGHHTLRAVQIERTVSGWRVARSGSAPTPADTVRDGVVIDPTIMGLAIKNLLKASHINATSAAIAISGGTVVVRPIRMPKMAESALRKSIKFEASRYVPNSVEDSYIEFEIIGEADAANMDVIIAAAPRELVDSRVEACSQAGLEVEHVEVAMFAAYRAIIEADHGRPWSEQTLGLVDIGANVTNLGVVSKGAFSMTRAIPAGGQVLTDALKSYFKLSDADAEAGKAQLDVRGLLSETSVAENPPLRILHTHIDDLVREVRRSINYWQSQQNEAASAKHVDVIVLCGGGSNLPGLPEYFQHKLGIETIASGVFDNPRFLNGNADETRGREVAVSVGLAMGLAPTNATAKEHKPTPKKEAKVATPKPPKDPKPTKPTKPPKPPKAGKGRTFKVSVPVDAPEAQEPVTAPAETVEIAASATLPASPMPVVAPSAKPSKLSTARDAAAPTEAAPAPSERVDEGPPTKTADIQAIEEPVQPTAAKPAEPAATVEPEAAPDVAAKYGPELAALIGALEEESPVVVTKAEHHLEPPEEVPAEAPSMAAPVARAEQPEAPHESEPTVVEATATPSLESAIEGSQADSVANPVAEQMAADTADAAVLAATAPAPEAAPEPTPVPAAKATPDTIVVPPPVAEKVAPIAATTSETDASVAPIAHVNDGGVPKNEERQALWDAPVEAPPVAKATILTPPPAKRSHKAESAPKADTKVGSATKKSLFSFGKKPEKAAPPEPQVAEKPAAKKGLFGAKDKPKGESANKPAKAEKLPTPATERPGKKGLFARAEKSAKPKAAKQAQASDDPGAFKKAASWLFGGPKPHAKPTGLLTPKTVPPSADISPTTVASRDKEIELLRGSSLEPVDATLRDSKPSAPDPRPEPKVLADEANTKEQEGAGAPKPETKETPGNPEQEAA